MWFKKKFADTKKELHSLLKSYAEFLENDIQRLQSLKETFKKNLKEINNISHRLKHLDASFEESLDSEIASQYSPHLEAFQNYNNDMEEMSLNSEIHTNRSSTSRKNSIVSHASINDIKIRDLVLDYTKQYKLIKNNLKLFSFPRFQEQENAMESKIQHYENKILKLLDKKISTNGNLFSLLDKISEKYEIHALVDTLQKLTFKRSKILLKDSDLAEYLQVRKAEVKELFHTSKNYLSGISGAFKPFKKLDEKNQTFNLRKSAKVAPMPLESINKNANAKTTDNPHSEKRLKMARRKS